MYIIIPKAVRILAEGGNIAQREGDVRKNQAPFNQLIYVTSLIIDKTIILVYNY